MATPRRATTCRWTTLQARSPPCALRPDPRLRPLLAHRYESFAGTGDNTPRVRDPGRCRDAVDHRRRGVTAASRRPGLRSERLPHRRRRRLPARLHRDVPRPTRRLQRVRAGGGRDGRIDRRPRGPRRRRRSTARRTGPVRADVGAARTAARRLPARPLRPRTATVAGGERGVGPPRALGRDQRDRRHRPPGRLEPQTPHHQVQATSRRDATPRRQAAATVTGLAARRQRSQLGAHRRRLGLRRSIPPRPRVPPVHRHHTSALTAA